MNGSGENQEFFTEKSATDKAKADPPVGDGAIQAAGLSGQFYRRRD